MKISRIAAATCALGLTATLSIATLPATAAPAAPHGPKNVIVMIGDGMGYTHVNASTLYTAGQAYKQVEGAEGSVTEVAGTPTFAFEKFPVQVDMTTYWAEGSYDPAKAWNDFDY